MSNQFIDREHPEYAGRKAVWQKCRDFYSGGEELRKRAATYLIQRAKEPPEIFQERLERVFYENYLGSIVDWYSATLMRREPSIQFEGDNLPGITFFDEFVGNCDKRGTPLSEFFRRRFRELLTFGRTFVAVEFPRMNAVALSRAEEDAMGSSRAYLVDYSPDECINWSHDEYGRLEWVVLRTRGMKQAAVTDEAWVKETRWIYYDRRAFRVYSQRAAGAIELVDEGLHGLAEQDRVPVFELSVSDGLWLMNKGLLLQIEHFNKSNALAWALTMGLFAMPVVYSDRKWEQIIGESYYIQLAPGDRFGWTEPEGRVFQIATDNLERLKEEIYRVCYLMNQAGNQHSSARQSGLSKVRDFAITQEILRSYGSTVKEGIRQVLEAINVARKDGLFIDVLGMDEFDIGDFGTELDDAKRLLELGIQSDTLKKQVFKQLALKYFCDVRQDVKNKIASEIDDSFQKT